MKIREIVETDRADWVRLREALGPGSLSDHDAETRKYFEKPPNAPIVFVAEADGRLVGFLELDFRKYAPQHRRCRSMRRKTTAAPCSSLRMPPTSSDPCA